MSHPPLSRELALRIGLASYVLSGIESVELIAILDKAVGMPLTEEKFMRLGLKAFRKAGGEALLRCPAEEVKKALHLLKGESVEAEDELPQIDLYEDGDMPGSIRVACASNRGEDLDGHFGSCSRFLVYQVSAEESRLIDVRASSEPEDGADKNAWRAGLIADCQVLMVASIGGPAAAKVVRANVHPIKHPHGGEARNVLADLQKVLAGSPPPWLARVMGREAETLAPFREGAEA